MVKPAVQLKKVGQDLTQGSVFKGMMMFAVPIILTNLIQQLYSMADLMIIGLFAGNTGTVGVATGGEMSDFLTPVATAFATAGQVIIAQLCGAKNKEKLKESIGTFLSMMVFMSVVFLGFTVVFRIQILKLLNCPAEAFGQAEAYMIITALGLPFIFGYNAVCGILRGMGESKKPLLFIIIAAVVNVFLDVFLVAVIPLEAAGTAIATSFSQLAAFLAAWCYMCRNKEQFGIEMKLSCFKIRKEPAMLILSLGVPQAARSLLVRVSMLWVNSNINGYGIVASATNSVGNKLQKFLEIFSSSLSQASASVVAQNLGAKKPERAKQVVWYSCFSCLAIVSCITLLILACPREIFGIFTKEPAVLDLGVIYLHIMIVHFFLSAVTSSFQSMVIGAGNASLNFIIGMMDGIVCKVGFSILFANVLSMGVLGYFWGTAISRAVPGIICIVYFFSGKWNERKLLTE